MVNRNWVTEYRVGRNFIRKGDRVHVKKGWSGKHNGFDTTVLAILANEDGSPAAVNVTNPHTGNVHSLRPEHIQRRRQTKAGAKL